MRMGRGDRSERTLAIIKERESGMSCSEIGKKYGISKQRVQQISGTNRGNYFAPIKESQCIYPNLRNWMNDNKIARAEFLRRMGYQSCPRNITKLSGVMLGANMRKDYIDVMLKVTGLTYEELFYKDGDT